MDKSMNMVISETKQTIMQTIITANLPAEVSALIINDLANRINQEAAQITKNEFAKSTEEEPKDIEADTK